MHFPLFQRLFFSNFSHLSYNFVCNINFSFYFQQTCITPGCDCFYDSQCLKVYSNNLGRCTSKEDVCPDKVRESDRSRKCRGCIAQCFDRRAGRNGRYSLYCCDCPPPPPPPVTRCFPSTATVSLENGKSVKMSELQVTDKVQIRMYLQFLIFT